MRGVIVAAPQSGSGKTAFTQALIRLLVKQGKDVIPAKLGPDYIDPQFLSLASCVPDCCVNLDSWAMREDSLSAIIDFTQQRTPKGLWVIEGAMGLFDGSANGEGSPADIAEKLDLPIILLVNTAKQAASVAALVQGFVRHRPQLSFAGLVLNRVASKRHDAMLKQALGKHCPDIPILASVYQDESWTLPERHLGLVQASELQDHNQRLNRMAEHLARDFDDTLFLSRIATESASLSGRNVQALLKAPKAHIAMAYDQAFGFIYSAQINLWRQNGVQISFFSPLKDEGPNPKAECILLAGGYPELFAAELGQAKNFQHGMKQALLRGVPIHGECGGYMVLGDSLEDTSGKVWPMLGFLPVEFTFHQRRQGLGYRQVSLLTDHIFGKVGDTFRAHEFHYAQAHILQNNTRPLFTVKDALGNIGRDQGVVFGNVSGSFQHLIDHFFD